MNSYTLRPKGDIRLSQNEKTNFTTIPIILVKKVREHLLLHNLIHVSLVCASLINGNDLFSCYLIYFLLMLSLALSRLLL